MMTAPESVAGSDVAMDGRGKLAARSAAACEEEASTSLEVVLAGGGVDVGVVAAVDAIAAATAVAVVVVAVSGAACTDAVMRASPVEAIAVAPPKFGRLSSGG